MYTHILLIIHVLLVSDSDNVHPCHPYNSCSSGQWHRQSTPMSSLYFMFFWSVTQTMYIHVFLIAHVFSGQWLRQCTPMSSLLFMFFWSVTQTMYIHVFLIIHVLLVSDTDNVHPCLPYNSYSSGQWHRQSTPMSSLYFMFFWSVTQTMYIHVFLIAHVFSGQWLRQCTPMSSLLFMFFWSVTQTMYIHVFLIIHVLLVSDSDNVQTCFSYNLCSSGQWLRQCTDMFSV